MRAENVDASPRSSSARPETFRHEAFVHRGDDEFLEGTVPFVRAALEAEEPILVAVGAERIELLRRELDGAADGVLFADMIKLGRNPRRIIPAWREFLSQHAADGRPARGIGAPVWATRSTEELDECHQHEALLNVAFADTPGFWLLCPYDVGGLAPQVVENAHATHPHVFDGQRHRTSEPFMGLGACVEPGPPLPAAPAHADQITFDSKGLGPVRDLVASHARRAGLDPDRIDDLNLAVNEVATNSVRHGGGGGVLHMWAEHDRVVCEVTDSGHIRDPLAGRVLPPPDRPSGRGLWIANHLCDLVQIRSGPGRTVVRLQMATH